MLRASVFFSPEPGGPPAAPGGQQEPDPGAGPDPDGRGRPGRADPAEAGRLQHEMGRAHGQGEGGFRRPDISPDSGLLLTSESNEVRADVSWRSEHLLTSEACQGHQVSVPSLLDKCWFHTLSLSLSNFLF